MKKLLISLLAAAGLAGAVHAEGTGTKFNAGAYKIYKSSDAVSSTTGQGVTTGPAILHKVIISSPAYSVSESTNAVFRLYDSVGSEANLRADINVSTQSLSSGPTEYTFDIAFSSGIRTDYQGNVATGKINLIWTRPTPSAPDAYKVWTSSFIVGDTAVHRLAAGPVLLHKIIVLTKGTGTAILTAYDSYVSASPAASRRIAGIDLTDAAREYTYNVLCSSGITLQSSGAGTVVPGYLVLYKRNPSQDFEVWRSTFTTGTASNIMTVWGTDWIFGGVVNGDSVSGSSMSVYDSSGSASNLITTVDGAASYNRRMYDVNISSGITYTSSGNGLFSILYKRRNQ